MNTPDCETIRALLPAYSVGATDPDETREVEQGLVDCPELAAELEEYRAMSDALLLSMPTAAPPAHLSSRLMEAIALPVPALSPVSAPSPATAPPSKTRVLPLRLWQLGAAAAAILLLVTNGLWLREVTTLREREIQITQLLTRQDEVLAALGSSQAQRVELASADSSVYASVLWSPETDVALLRTASFPELASDRVYQLWLIRGDERLSGGLFSVDEQGVGTLIFEPGQPLDQFDAVGITAEPAGGSPAPTSNPVVAAEV